MYEGIVYIVFFGIVVEVALPAALFTAPGCITGESVSLEVKNRGTACMDSV